jgi:hypothetical protein
MKRKLTLSILLVALLLLVASPALAQIPNAPLPTNYCSGADYDEDRCLTFFDGAGAFISEWGVTLAISVISIITMVVWFLDRAALALFELVTGGSWLLDLKTDFIDGIASFLPDVLRDTAFGPTGLMYIALVLAGILMTIPIMAQGINRLAKPGRVMTWGVLLSVLFVSGTVGYDLIDRVETMRQDMMQATIGTEADYGVTKLILVPMHAQESEAALQLTDLSTLPNDFMTRFYPEVEKIDISVKVVESGWFGVVESEIESPESKLARIAGAVLALFYSMLGFFAGIIVLLSGVTYVILGVAALFLILFLFAALPLGFFEFGESILRMIVERYVQVIMYSLGVSIFIRLAGGMVDQLPNLSDVGTLLQWLLLMIVFYLALHAIMKSSFGLLSASFMTFNSSIGAVWSGSGPSAGPGLMDKAKQVAGGAVTGALLMGGAPGALMGAAGSALGIPMMMRGGAAAASQAAESTVRSEPTQGDVFQNNGAAALQTEPVSNEPSAPVENASTGTDIFAPPAAAPASATAETAATAAQQNAQAEAAPFGASSTTKNAAETARTISA